jgi:hypothetical protein
MKRPFSFIVVTSSGLEACWAQNSAGKVCFVLFCFFLLLTLSVCVCVCVRVCVCLGNYFPKCFFEMSVSFFSLPSSTSFYLFVCLFL